MKTGDYCHGCNVGVINCPKINMDTPCTSCREQEDSEIMDESFHSNDDVFADPFYSSFQR